MAYAYAIALTGGEAVKVEAHPGMWFDMLTWVPDYSVRHIEVVRQGSSDPPVAMDYRNMDPFLNIAGMLWRIPMTPDD